ncbi:FAD-binding protein [Rhodococcus hoagii]|nr:FAD-binding protein [Prescottella equi]
MCSRTCKRFVNEVLGYHDYTLAMVQQVPGARRCARGSSPTRSTSSTCRWASPSPADSDLAVPALGLPHPRATLRVNSAEKIGVDPVGLEQTVEAFNVGARAGVDAEFGRGTTPFTIGSGDYANPWPNAALAPLQKGPFYAVKVLPGSFGTFAGLVTDAESRVLNSADEPVPGLFAVGVDQSSVMGGHYPSGGINLGPAMTFGFLTGRRLASTTGENR